MSQLLEDKYEIVVGLEVHAQLLTQTKAYSSDSYSYGAIPNSQTSPISLAHPGTLPRPNNEALKMALMMGMACESTIHKKTYFARKNYFYPDLPKGYQITQFTRPIATGGFIQIKPEKGEPKKIGLDKIIMEEDSGKSIHDLDPFATLIDLNRAGVPLIEIVSCPDIRQPEEAYQYLHEVRRTLRYLGICDGNMEEGSMRCDANISVRLKGTDVLNTRVEVKNINSMRNVARAIAFEGKRQMKVVEEGGIVTPDTRGFDAAKGETYEMRSKEMANDYRYFPDPDIPPFELNEEYISEVRAQMPELPEALYNRFINEYGLSEYDAGVIVNDKDSMEFFLELTSKTKSYKAAANWLNGPIRNYLNETAGQFSDFPISHEQLADIIAEVEKNTLSFAAAANKLFPELLQRGRHQNVSTLIEELNLAQVADTDYLAKLVDDALQKNPDKVEEYKKGKKGLLGMFMADVMKQSQGKADPKLASTMLRERLEG